MAEFSDDGLLLRRIPFSETSLICHILTAQHGRITVMARGARRPKSPFRATLAPVYRLRVNWRPGRSGMGTLTDVQRGAVLVSDARMLAALELSAVASQLFQEGDPQGYDELIESLELLEARQADEGQCAALWLMLERAGWLGDLLHCWQCGREMDDGELMHWQDAQLCCGQCGSGMDVTAGLRKGIAGVIRQANVHMPDRDRERFRTMLGLLLREHGVKPPDSFRQR